MPLFIPAALLCSELPDVPMRNPATCVRDPAFVLDPCGFLSLLVPAVPLALGIATVKMLLPQPPLDAGCAPAV
eukprot:scaffold98050_cov20-Tisochrysis_lutea.AAC.1